MADLYQIIGRQQERIAELEERVQNLANILAKLKRGEMSLDSLTFVAPTQEPVAASTNGSEPDED